MIGFYTKNIAFTGTAQTTFYFPDAVHRIASHP